MRSLSLYCSTAVFSLFITGLDSFLLSVAPPGCCCWSGFTVLLSQFLLKHHQLLLVLLLVKYIYSHTVFVLPLMSLNVRLVNKWVFDDLVFQCLLVVVYLLFLVVCVCICADWIVCVVLFPQYLCGLYQTPASERGSLQTERSCFVDFKVMRLTSLE